MPKHKSNIIPFRRIAAIAACLVLVFSFATSANAFCFRDVWNAVVTWAQETFSFSMGVEVSKPEEDDLLEYTSIQEVLDANGRNPSVAPTWIPNGYTLDEIIIDKTPLQESYIVVYTNGNTSFRITIQSFVSVRPEQYEQGMGFDQIYSASGTDYYIISNYDKVRVAWVNDMYECNISGALSIDEVKAMIDSISKG